MLTAGSALKEEREKKGYSLEEVAATTKINKQYLEALEHDDFDKFPSSVYARGFLQSYAKFLELDVEKILALYRRSIAETETPEVTAVQKPIKQPRFVLTPGIVIVAIIAVIVVGTLGYLFFQFYNFQKPPNLSIVSPEGNATLNESEVTVEGTTDPGMFVTINDEPVRVADTGSFEATLVLSSGSNTVIVKARHPDNIGQEAVVTLNLEYVPPKEEIEEEEEEEPEEEKEIVELALAVDVGPQNAWIEVEVDGEQVIASVAPAGTNYTYTGTASVYVRTGKVSSTKVTVNNEVRELFSEGGGVASITCELKEGSVNCRQP